MAAKHPMVVNLEISVCSLLVKGSCHFSFFKLPQKVTITEEHFIWQYCTVDRCNSGWLVGAVLWLIGAIQGG